MRIMVQSSSAHSYLALLLHNVERLIAVLHVVSSSVCASLARISQLPWSRLSSRGRSCISKQRVENIVAQTDKVLLEH